MNTADASVAFVVVAFAAAILHSASMTYIAWRIGRIAAALEKREENRNAKTP